MLPGCHFQCACARQIVYSEWQCVVILYVCFDYLFLNSKNLTKVGEMGMGKWIRYPQFGRVKWGVMLGGFGFGGLKNGVDKLNIND